MLGKNTTRIADLKVELLAILIAQIHTELTSESVFAMGGELLELHRKSLSALKRHDDGSETSLRMKIQVSKKMSFAEKQWRDRLLEVLRRGAWKQ